jgi:hypothetical protein
MHSATGLTGDRWRLAGRPAPCARSAARAEVHRFREEFFAAPIHWGFVLGVWFALGVSGILQQVSRLIQLLDQIEDAA